MIELAPLLARVPKHESFWPWEVIRERVHRLCADYPGLARCETVGESVEGRPIELLAVGHGRRHVLLVGVPHPNEPVGTLTIDFLAQLLCEDEALRTTLDCTLWIVPVADPDGLVLNAGWLGETFSPLRYALEFYRPPHCEQVEWSFPVEYRTLRFARPTPETAAVMRVMERVRPQLFYSLHNAGFCGVYFYVSALLPGLAPAFQQLVAEQGLALHRGEPEVPYLRELAPAIFALFGIDETYEYLARTLDVDPAPLIESGTSADDWLKMLCPEAFSLVCEVPYYTSPLLADLSPAGESRRAALLAGIARSRELHAATARHYAELAPRLPDHRLTRSVRDYVEKTPRRLAADERQAADPAYEREATRAEQVDARVCGLLHHACYRGELRRLAVLAGDRARAARIEQELLALVTEIERESRLCVLPLRPLVATQAGAGLLAMAATAPA